MFINTLTTISILISIHTKIASSGILYPRTTETRELIPLDGLWDFALANSTDPLRGSLENWFNMDLRTINGLNVDFIPVPASYNDIGVEAGVRDHVGLVWYQRRFMVPKAWETSKKVWIRFSSVCTGAEVWINGKWAASHDIGHLPFQAEITALLNFNLENTITVAVDNTLTPSSIPQGNIEELVSGRLKQTYTFDFFNYAGIDRPVVLYTTPQTHIEDLTVLTEVEGNVSYIHYEVEISGTIFNKVIVLLYEKSGTFVTSAQGANGTLVVPEAKLWWPYLMDSNPGYQYYLHIELRDSSDHIIDKYVQKIGIRSLKWNHSGLFINDKRVYLRGFGRHEDSDIRGKGLDLPLILRDYKLIQWIGANSYRTSHYPYAEEIMDLADEYGIMIIDECPGVNTEDFNDELLENHKKSLTELIQRDKNRPGVIIWSLANEPRTQYQASQEYFRQVVEHVKSWDLTRPVTIVNAQTADHDHSGQYLDIACVNMYIGWYHATGDLDVVISTIVAMTQRWNEKHNISVILTEYGADTLEGLHLLPSYAWSEEYQNMLLSKHFQAFDRMRNDGYFIGEMIWNFADFKTAQTYTRVGGNKKGIFTRNRQPKSSAHLLRKRYWSLAKNLDQAEVPHDLNEYVYSSGTDHDEL